MTIRNRNQRSLWLILFMLGLVIIVTLVYCFVSSNVTKIFGSPAKSLGLQQRIIYPFELLLHKGELISANLEKSQGVQFEIQAGESVQMVCLRMEELGLVPDASTMRLYLVYSGLDRQLITGNFLLNKDMAPVEIASIITDQKNTTVNFNILPGWRIDEIAVSLKTSGLEIDQQDFLSLAYDPPEQLQILVGLSEGQSVEGYLFPGTYVFARDISGFNFLKEAIFKFASDIDQQLLDAFSDHGLSMHEAVTLASIIQREAIHEEEFPIIASVFLNRLDAGMFMETDPTVQYALGFDLITNSWWKSPLTYADLGVDSPYNTYNYPGLPPGPISNPSLAAILSVAYPAETPYYFFRASCDNTGLHNFAVTYEEHLANECP